MAWRITECSWRNREVLGALLADSWEPFAVTDGDGVATVWLRRSAEPAEAGVLPRPPRGEPEVTR